LWLQRFKQLGFINHVDRLIRLEIPLTRPGFYAMRGARLLLPTVTALAVGAFACQQPAHYVVDPNNGQPAPVVSQQTYASPDYAQQTYQQPAAQSYAQSGGRGLFSSSPASAQQSYTQQSYAQQNTVPPPQAPPSGRGLFNRRMSAAQPYVQQPYAPQTYTPQNYAQPPMAPQYVRPQAGAQGGPYVAAPYGYASAPEQACTLDSGDKLRVVVFGQDGITNSYTLDADGNINLPPASWRRAAVAHSSSRR
jgi:hypothetical protein